MARHLWKEMLFTISIEICFYLFFWPAEKGIHFKFQWYFTLKRGKFILKSYFVLYLMCYIAHQWFIWTTRNLSFRIYFYIATRRSEKTTIIFFTFVTGVKHTSWCLIRPWYKYSLRLSPASLVLYKWICINSKVRMTKQVIHGNENFLKCLAS